MTDARIELTATVLDELATCGHWCPDCALPSVVEVPWVLLPIGSLDVLARGTIRICDGCGDVVEAAKAAGEEAQRQVDAGGPDGDAG